MEGGTRADNCTPPTTFVIVTCLVLYMRYRMAHYDIPLERSPELVDVFFDRYPEETELGTYAFAPFSRCVAA